MANGNRRARTRPHDEDQAPARIRMWLDENDAAMAGLVRLRELRGSERAVWAVLAVPGRIYPIDAPEGVLEHLGWKDAYRRPNRDGTYRGYVVYDARCHCGGHVKLLRERTDTTPEDVKQGFNRSENVRMFPPGSPPYLVAYPERNDTESINRRVDDHLPLRRARSYGWKRQLLDLLAHNHVVNSVARFRYGPEGTHRLQVDEQAA